MNNNQPTLNDIYNRAVEQVAQQFDCAHQFLIDYESLKFLGVSILDERYSELEKVRICFDYSLESAHAKAFSFQLLFSNTEYRDRLMVMTAWTRELRFSYDVFQNIEHYKQLINKVSIDLRSGTLETSEFFQIDWVQSSPGSSINPEKVGRYRMINMVVLVANLKEGKVL
ncbi:hypothetical protein [Methylobacter sp.]|uniref:hypothetical protein n=1 Tax=Methylobacter sp. TaxID=2051955 RepID=UPI002487EF86|nr:hypothetical protein [Methylobacter sp.]MDI1278630.1 hypothetical protein [Methylobacter sp.]MDI1359450.1 hypothetical protein [Methylobacter sp.]